jgi:hypothetical protein
VIDTPTWIAETSPEPSSVIVSVTPAGLESGIGRARCDAPVTGPLAPRPTRSTTATRATTSSAAPPRIQGSALFFLGGCWP